MNILINTDNSIDGNERTNKYFSEAISKDLARFKNDITRIEVHLTDENGSKTGKDDKKCTMEARVKNHQPIVVSCNEDSIEKAMNIATTKLKSALTSLLGELKSHR
jgi:hypothetical protein